MTTSRYAIYLTHHLGVFFPIHGHQSVLALRGKEELGAREKPLGAASLELLDGLAGDHRLVSGRVELEELQLESIPLNMSSHS